MGGISKTVFIAIGIILLAIGASVLSLMVTLVNTDLSPEFYGMVLVWIGGLLFFYGVITEEHTMKELYLRHAYFITGLLTMISGLFFVFIAILLPCRPSADVVSFGMLLLLFGSALVLLSAQKTRDYSKWSAFFGTVGGLLLIWGGIMAGSVNISYIGVFMLVFSAAWFGLRSRYAV